MFVSFLFALGTQRERGFWWNMGIGQVYLQVVAAAQYGVVNLLYRFQHHLLVRHAHTHQLPRVFVLHRLECTLHGVEDKVTLSYCGEILVPSSRSSLKF